LMFRVGAHAPVQGFTDRAYQAAVALNAAVFLWTPACGPQDALRFPDALHVVRLDNWTVDIAPSQYVANESAQINRWRSIIPAAVFQCGNEPDIESDHGGQDFPRYAAALRAAFPGILLANPPLSVEKTYLITTDGADYVACHSYFERQHPEDIGNEGLGASYRLALRAAGTKQTIVTEFNVVQTNCPIDWPDRNKQAAAWLDQAEADGVAGVCFFILDAAPDWASFDVGPEAAADILAHRHQTPAPAPQPSPPPIPPPVPAPPVTGAYTRSSDPRGYRVLDRRWEAFIAQHNPQEADVICAYYDQACEVIGYDANCAIAQGCVETEIFTSPRWKAAHNAAGIGIYADSTPDVQFGDVATGVRAQVELLSDYYCGGVEPWGVLKRYGFGGMNLGKTKLSDMDGVWAADTGYSAAIVGYLNQVVGGTQPAPAPPTGPTLEDIYRIALTYVGATRTDEGSAEFGMCEQFVEEVVAKGTGKRVRYPTAAAHDNALHAAGVPFVTGPWKRGMILSWNAPFDPDGHTCVAADFPMVITTHVSGVIAVIDAEANGWYGAAGYSGAYVPDGVGDGAPVVEEIDMKVETAFDDGVLARQWRGPSTAAAFKKIGGYDGARGIDAAWRGELEAGRPLGFAISNEEADKPSGRIVRYFSNGRITYFTADGSVKIN
jgi:hypothetical protein